MTHEVLLFLVRNMNALDLSCSFYEFQFQYHFSLGSAESLLCFANFQS